MSLATNINNLKNNYTYFNNIHEDFGMMRTIAGMVASQCGIPLLGGNSLQYSDKFLPNAICMGDILKNDEYYNVYIGGADLEFAGKGNFYKTHGFEETYGLYELKELFSEKNTHSWGYYDEDVFNFLYEKYIDLKQKHKKFSLFSINLGTHDEGVIDQICKKNIDYKNIEYKKQLGEYDVLDAFKCSDFIIGDFVNKLIKNGELKNTVIVLQADHYVMGISSISKYIRQNYDFEERGIPFIIIDENGTRLIDKKGLTIDIGPTVLSSLGFEIQSLGLGRNLLNKNNKTTFEQNIDLKQFVAYYSMFLELPKFDNIEIKNEKIILGNAQFDIPIYMEFEV